MLGMKTGKRKSENEELVGKLPPEVWGEIWKRLGSRLDLTGFRSVCRTWRSSLPPPIRFPLHLPAPPGVVGTKFDSVPYFITEDTYYLHDDGRTMLMVLEEVDQGGKFHPCAYLQAQDVTFTGPPPKPPVPDDISRLSFVSKVHAVRMASLVHGRWRLRPARPVLKLLLISPDPSSSGVYPSYRTDLTAVALLDTEKLAVLRLFGGNHPLHHHHLNWETTPENEFSSSKSSSYKDIILYNSKLYAIDSLGRVSIMDYSSLKMTQVSALPSCGINITMRFAEASGNLYLFTVKPGPGPLDLIPDPEPSDLKIYKQQQQQQWVEIRDLGDQVFLLAWDKAFSVPRHVFAATGLMDSRCCYEKKAPCFLAHTLVFSDPIQHRDDDDDDKKNQQFRIVRLTSSYCIKPWDQLPPAVEPTPATPTSSVIAQFDYTTSFRYSTPR